MRLRSLLTHLGGRPRPARAPARLMVGAVALALAVSMPAVTARADDTGSTVPAGRMVDLRVATYNIAAGAGADGRFDVERQIEAMRALDADIIGLQEVDVTWHARSQWRDLATEIAAGLGMYVFFGPIYDLDPPAEGQPRRRFGNALLSRYPILQAENHWITRLSTQVPNPVPEPAPGFPEIVVNVRGALVHVYGTHLDFRGDPAVRHLQVADMLGIMAEDRGRRQILLGDLNARPDAVELAPLWAHLADAWLVGGSGPEMTYPASAPDRRIDYVTVSARIAVRAARVPPTLASDHLPVVADLTVTRGENGAP
jgi:endonuclease/exonuclease/phosphatase family metal-dependent hydrolase